MCVCDEEGVLVHVLEELSVPVLLAMLEPLALRDCDALDVPLRVCEEEGVPVREVEGLRVVLGGRMEPTGDVVDSVEDEDTGIENDAELEAEEEEEEVSVIDGDELGDADAVFVALLEDDSVAEMEEVCDWLPEDVCVALWLGVPLLLALLVHEEEDVKVTEDD